MVLLWAIKCTTIYKLCSTIYKLCKFTNCTAQFINCANSQIVPNRATLIHAWTDGLMDGANVEFWIAT